MTKYIPYDIAIIGLGTRGARQLTVEHLEVLEKGRDIIVAPGTHSDLLELFRKLKLRIHDVGSIYKDGSIASQVYLKIANKVLQFGKRYGRTIFAQYGHPLIYCRPSEIILEESKKLGLRTYIYSGISSIDEILNLLEIDIGLRDIQICHAAPLLRDKKVINPQMDLVLMQVARIGEETLCLDVEKRAHQVKIDLFQKFQTYLEKFYPKNHPMRIICLNGALDGSDQIVEASIGDLVKIAPLLHVAHTVYIKALV